MSFNKLLRSIMALDGRLYLYLPRYVCHHGAYYGKVGSRMKMAAESRTFLACLGRSATEGELDRNILAIVA